MSAQTTEKIMRPRERATIPFSIKLGLSIFSPCLNNANVGWLGVKITASFYSSSMIQKDFRSSQIISSKLKQKHFFTNVCFSRKGKVVPPFLGVVCAIQN